MTFSTGKKTVSVRDYLNDNRVNLMLDWKYDAAQNSIVFDFPWHRPPSRPARELVDLISKTSPVPMKELSNLKAPDPWRQALAELMSEPETFPHAWKVQLEDASSSSLFGYMTFSDDNSHSYLLQDADGREHLLLLHYHPPLMTPGPNPSFAFYLFTADGRWEDGGLFEAGTTFSLPVIKYGPEKKQVTLEIDSKPLVFTDAKGKQTTIPASPNTYGIYTYVLQIQRGELSGACYRNGAPLTSQDYQIGMTPLRHLRD